MKALLWPEEEDRYALGSDLEDAADGVPAPLSRVGQRPAQLNHRD
jgi:hypothetical protein